MFTDLKPVGNDSAGRERSVMVNLALWKEDSSDMILVLMASADPTHLKQ